MRDLKADLELCNKATPGPWLETDKSNLEVFVENTWGEPVLYELQYDGPHTAIKQEDMEFMIAARAGWPHAIERALEAEKRVEELENQVDILSTTLNMYCSPYYDMRERAEKAEALAWELVEALEMAFDLLEHHQPNWYTWAHFHQINNALGSYKEVLGDEKA